MGNALLSFRGLEIPELQNVILPPDWSTADGTFNNIFCNSIRVAEPPGPATVPNLVVLEYQNSPTDFSKMNIEANAGGPFLIQTQSQPNSANRPLQFQVQTTFDGTARRWQIDNVGNFNALDINQNIGGIEATFPNSRPVAVNAQNTIRAPQIIAFQYSPQVSGIQLNVVPPPSTSGGCVLFQPMNADPNSQGSQAVALYVMPGTNGNTAKLVVRRGGGAPQTILDNIP